MNPKITIREDFKNLIPPLSDAEREQLHSSLDTRGCIDPLRVWKEEGVLLDGHNRYEYCTKNNIPFNTVEISCSNENVAKNWMILNQLGRRNLSPDTAELLRGKLYNSRKKDQGAPVGNDNASRSEKQSGQSGHIERTEEIIAKETGVSPRTVRRAGQFAEACDKLGVTQDVITGKEKRSRKAIVAAANPKEENESGEASHIQTATEILAPRLMGGQQAENHGMKFLKRMTKKGRGAFFIHAFAIGIEVEVESKSELEKRFSHWLSEFVKEGKI